MSALFTIEPEARLAAVVVSTDDLLALRERCLEMAIRSGPDRAPSEIVARAEAYFSAVLDLSRFPQEARVAQAG